jgi:hypothetical protein
MSTLFLIGNGFDLNCGCKTSYKDVYVEYLKSPSETETIAKFKSTISANIENWGDFEMAMGKYARKLDTEAEFIQCANDFKVFLSGYLATQQRDFFLRTLGDEIDLVVSDEIRKSIAGFYRGISENVNYIMEQNHAGLLGNCEFVSFNYTDILDTLLKDAYPNNAFYDNKICHVHGKLEDLTMGVDTESQIEANFFSRRLKRCFVKPYFNKIYDDSRVNRAKRAIINARTICVFGMSLGDSDLTWRNLLIEWFINDPSHHLFLYDYNMVKKKPKTIDERMSIEEEAKIQKLKEWGLDINEDDIVFERFHMVCGANIFNVDKAIKRVEKRKQKQKSQEVVKQL